MCSQLLKRDLSLRTCPKADRLHRCANTYRDKGSTKTLQTPTYLFDSKCTQIHKYLEAILWQKIRIYTKTQIHKYFTNPKVNQWQQSRRSSPEQRPPSRGADLAEQPGKIILNSQLRCRNFVCEYVPESPLVCMVEAFHGASPTFLQ